MLTEAFPLAPAIVVICDNDSIHHAHSVTAYLEQHPRLEVYGACYSPHDNSVERIWAGLKNYVATAHTGHSGHNYRGPTERLVLPLRQGQLPGAAI